jgi:S1-C subfamily serine protease
LPQSYGSSRSGQARGVGAGFTVASSTVIGTPIYKAGIDAGDVITKADGKDIVDGSSFSTVLSGKKPGDQLVFEYTNRTGSHTTTVTLEESPALEVVTFEKAGKTPGADQLTFRNNWLSSKVK